MEGGCVPILRGVGGRSLHPSQVSFSADPGLGSQAPAPPAMSERGPDLSAP